MSFEEYVAQRGEGLLRLAFVLTSDGHKAEDLAQSALLDAYREWPKVAAADDPDRYVRRILINRHLSSRRVRASTERTLEPGSGIYGEASDHADSVVSTDQMRWLLRDLPPRARTVLVLRYFSDLDDGSIAELMGTTESTVRATASRALRTLREHVGSHAIREG